MFVSKKNKIAKKQFEEACVEHLDGLYAAAIKLTRNTSNAEELVQDTFVRAFRFANSFEWGTNLKAWLYRIQTNTFINNYRHKKHERKYIERAAVEPIYDDILDKQAKEYAANPESHVFSKFFKAELDKALDELPEDFKIVVILSDLQDFSYKEIAEMLGCPIGTIMSRLHRGRKILQKQMIDHAISAGIIKSESQKSFSSNEATNLNEYRSKQENAK